jgi:hypothetical protein
MATNLADLLTTQTQSQIFQILLGIYSVNGFPVQSWQVGGVERTRVMAIATAIADVSGNYIPTAAAGGFLDYATGSWLQLLALELYNLPFNPATFTVGNITLTAASGVGTATYQAGQLIAVFGATGNRYLNTGTVVIPAGPGSVTGAFQAEFAGSSYSDPPSSPALTLSTPIPGVTLTNPAGLYSPVPPAHVGSGTGSVTPSGTVVGSHQFVIRIDSTGAVGVASWSYQLDGQPFVSAGTASSLLIPGTGVTVTLANGASGTSFVIGDTYLFNAPGNWITSQGSNAEADQFLAARCRARWSSLSSIPVSNFYFLLATSTPSVGSQVTQCLVIPDTVINNKVNIIVAGPVGALPGATITAIQTYINPRVPGTENPVVVSPSAQAITYAGTITVTASQLTSATNAINTALTNYNVGINGTLRLAKVIELIMDQGGVIDASGITINTFAANLILGSPGVFVVATTPPTFNFTYVTV